MKIMSAGQDFNIHSDFLQGPANTELEIRAKPENIQIPKNVITSVTPQYHKLDHYYNKTALYC